MRTRSAACYYGSTSWPCLKTGLYPSFTPHTIKRFVYLKNSKSYTVIHMSLITNHSAFFSFFRFHREDHVEIMEGEKKKKSAGIKLHLGTDRCTQYSLKKRKSRSEHTYWKKKEKRQNISIDLRSARSIGQFIFFKRLKRYASMQFNQKFFLG